MAWANGNEGYHVCEVKIIMDPILHKSPQESSV